jgi:hypothetical protein
MGGGGGEGEGEGVPHVRRWGIVSMSYLKAGARGVVTSRSGRAAYDEMMIDAKVFSY